MSEENSLNLSNIPSHQQNNDNQSHITVVDSPSSIPEDQKEREIRKRLADDINSSVILSEYDFYTVNKNNE